MDLLGWPARHARRRGGLLGSSALLAGAAAMVAMMALPPRAALGQAAPAPSATPQAVATTGAQTRLTQAQLEQLLAPVALYPDDLLMQMLMAATYPLEVVQAKRWLGQGQNGSLRGDALARALNAQPWDPSVKSLVPFPDVLTMMNDQLDWTQQLGDAVLAQQQDVMNAIQVLRGRAQAAGMLTSGPQQTVSVTPAANVPPPAPAAVVAPPPQVITIVPTQPNTVYVPAYNPNVVYGAWPYPASPPAYYPPPAGWGVGNALLTGMAFAGGAAMVGSLWGWASPGWGRGDIDVNVNRYNNINVNRAQISSNTWQHDVNHRQGVAYSSTDIRNRYAGDRADGAEQTQARDELRGRMDQAERGGGIGGERPGDRPGLGSGRPAGGEGAGLGGGDRPGAGNRPGGAGTATGSGAGGQRPAVQQNASGRPQARPAAQQQVPQSFQGMGSGGWDRAAAQRGAASRQGMAPRGGGRR
jgi:hypothetical protein